jgi:hypothetical protein
MPSFAEYWHIGEIAILFRSASDPKAIGVNNWLIGMAPGLGRRLPLRLMVDDIDGVPSYDITDRPCILHSGKPHWNKGARDENFSERTFSVILLAKLLGACKPPPPKFSALAPGSPVLAIGDSATLGTGRNRERISWRDWPSRAAGK